MNDLENENFYFFNSLSKIIIIESDFNGNQIKSKKYIFG